MTKKPTREWVSEYVTVFRGLPDCPEFIDWIQVNWTQLEGRGGTAENLVDTAISAWGNKWAA